MRFHFHWSDIHTLAFDFDGVFTDNNVFVDQFGNESVMCDRSDGLGFDLLRKFMHKHDWSPEIFILSTEVNPVVKARASKLKIKSYQNISNKLVFLKEYLASNNLSPSGLVYLGNDLNDLPVTKLDCYFIAPHDAHPFVLSRASCVLESDGGHGFVRHFIELLCQIHTLSSDQLFQLLEVNPK